MALVSGNKIDEKTLPVTKISAREAWIPRSFLAGTLLNSLNESETIYDMRIWLTKFLNNVEEHAISYSWASEQILRAGEDIEKGGLSEISMSLRSTQESPFNTETTNIQDLSIEIPPELLETSRTVAKGHNRTPTLSDI